MKRGPSPGRRASFLALLLAACAPAGPPAVAPAQPSPPPSPSPARVRYFHGTPEESFWVSRAPDLDRVVAGGVRLELGPGGEVRGAAWDTELAARGEVVLGALAVPDRLGGGFVAWTQHRVFRAGDYTGPLVPVPLGVPGETSVRGARAGLSSVIVVTESGPRELLPGASRLAPPKDPALLDLVAISAERAARLDVFGRFSITGDGGARWTDLSASTGAFVRQIAVGPRDLWIDGFQGRFLVDPRGKLDPGDAPPRGGYEQPRAFQIAWRNPREHDEWPWALRESSPIGVAVAAGGDIGDGTAFGVVQGAVVRVDLATGKLLAISTDWIPGGLECQAVRAPDGVLFACTWERSQGYGGYVLRSVAGAPPETEKAFGEDGSFVATDDGAIGFVGPCRSEPRTPDPNDQSRWETPNDPALRPVFCVRRGPGQWVERRVDPGEGAMVAAWVPRLDGTAAALALSSDPLPPPAGAPRVSEQGGVRLVRVYPEIPGRGWEVRTGQWDRGGLSGFVERRFRVRDDGSIDAWLLPANGGGDPPALAVTLDPSGIPTVHDPAPAGIDLLVGGSFGVSIARDGALHETTDHGHTWRPAGRSPLLPGAGSSAVRACSALGCALGAVVRVGWGDATLAPRISSDPLPTPAPVALPRLVCPPRGAPVPLVAPPPAPAGSRVTLSTGWGDTLDILHDAPSAPPLPKPPAPRKTTAVRGTSTLVVREPFAPFAAPRRLDATNAPIDVRRRTLVVPLLAPSGDVDVLVVGDQSELLVSGDRLSLLPVFEAHRYSSGDEGGFTGLSLPGGRALVLGEVRRRLSLEDHAPGPVPSPLFLGMDRSPLRRRSLVIARRDDGTLGVLVADGGAPETAGVAVVDRIAGSLRPVERLAPWSTLLTADDPRCRKGGDPRAWQALLRVDPSTWLALDPTALPGISLAHQGLLKVRWGTDRVCLEALDAAATDAQQRGDAARPFHLVARWSEGKGRGAALRATDLRQEVVCRLAGGN